MSRAVAAGFAALLLGLLVVAGFFAPDHMESGNAALALKGPLTVPPFGTDERGRSLMIYVEQGASVVVIPALLSGLMVGVLGTVGGLLRCIGSERVDGALQYILELLGSLPRMVVILVVALLLPVEWRGLLPLGMAWALLSAPGAMDEAAAVAERLGGARFVEALRAHGFSWSRIYLYHVVLMNLRPVVVRQAAETVLQVTFLEIALSYLAIQENQSSFTHSDSIHSWASLLQSGYRWLVVDIPTSHALALGLALIGTLTVAARLTAHAARAR
jgi:ABC-type dipeptide/oligopeptide/nickel transport system permease subunit